MTRDQAIELLRKHAKAKPESYYAEALFMPHEWAIDAVMQAPLWDFACQAGEWSDARNSDRPACPECAGEGGDCPECDGKGVA